MSWRNPMAPPMSLDEELQSPEDAIDENLAARVCARRWIRSSLHETLATLGIIEKYSRSASFDGPAPLCCGRSAIVRATCESNTPPFSMLRRKSVLHKVGPEAVARIGPSAIDYLDGLPGPFPHPPPTLLPRGAPVLVSGRALLEPANRGQPWEACALLVELSRGEIIPAVRNEGRGRFNVVVATEGLDFGAHRHSHSRKPLATLRIV